MDTNKYKIKLEEEKARIETELLKIARRNPENPDDWQATNPELELQSSDPLELADKFEEIETRAGLEGDMEGDLKKVTHALEIIVQGKYGQCEKCGEPIDERRLEASPAATFCVKHANNL
jgi:RNA polymerase-binding transcription factor DksA